MSGFQGLQLNAGMGFLLQKVMRYVVRDLERFREQHFINVCPRWFMKRLMKESFRGEKQDHGAKPDMVKVPGANSNRTLYCPWSRMHRRVTIVRCKLWRKVLS